MNEKELYLKARKEYFEAQKNADLKTINSYYLKMILARERYINTKSGNWYL